jgi:serine/threonine protein kinase
MGEVYRARDTRLGRTVAIKVCRERFSDRFQREARAIASLNHPNICTLYDVGPDYLVMEYIEGKPLRGPLPVQAVLRYGAQICDALEAAHRQGVTHRDLKPANILLAAAGVKLVDFGLAKMRPEAVGDTTVTVALDEPHTAQGTIVGTPHYMAPEQIEGNEVDARSDIFALGCVLYELAGGNKAFDGKTMASVIATILKDEPPALTELHAAVPASLDRVIRRCLAKDPESRWQNARDLKHALEDVRELEPAPPPLARRTGLRRLLWPAALLVAGVAVALIWLPPRKSNLSSYRLTPFVTEAGAEDSPAWSPDGKTLAYVADTDRVRQIFTRSLDASASTRVTNSADDCSLPFWSPDGSRIYYVS